MENIVVKIEGESTVEMPHDLVKFSLTLKAKGETLDVAKQKVADVTERVMKDLTSKDIKLAGNIVTEQSNYKLEHRENGEVIPAGFQSCNHVTLVCAADGSIDDLYRSCKAIDSNMPYPEFFIKESDREKLFEMAMELATHNVRTKLAAECKLLKVDPSALKILSWDFGNSHYSVGAVGITGSTGRMGPQGVAGVTGTIGPQGHMSYAPVMSKLGSIYQELLDVKLNPGQATRRVVVRVTYGWK